MAGVLAHEISHVTQQHVLRGAEKAQRESLPILLATLGAIIAAQQAGGTSSGDATSAAVMTGLGLLQQRQIDYTRDNESEADRVGIRTLARAGYDPEAMADFFQTLQSVVRLNQGDERSQFAGVSRCVSSVSSRSCRASSSWGVAQAVSARQAAAIVSTRMIVSVAED